MSRGNSRDLVVPVFVLAGVGAVAGAAVARRRRRGGPSGPDHVKLVSRRLIEEPWQGDLGVVDELVSESYVGDDLAEPKPIFGPAGVRASMGPYVAAFADVAFRVEDQVVEGDRVASRWTARGTHTGELAGIAPTGKEITISGTTITRVRNGKVVEGWTTWDRLGLLVQLGAVTEPAHA